MDKLEQYRLIIQDILQEYANFFPNNEVESELIFDTNRDHYVMIDVGWQNEYWVYGCILHFDIKNEKIWIQHNGTEFDVAEELVKKGVPKSDIVIGFHSPFKRQFTDYAVQ